MSQPPTGGKSRSLGRRIGYRVFWTITAFGAGAGFTFYHKQTIFLWLIAPADGKLSPFDGLPIYTSPISMISATISVVSKGGMAAALPVLTYSVLSLVRPLLPSRFYRFLIYLILATVASYLAGMLFVYYVMLPVGLGFLLNFGKGVAIPVIDIGEYLALLSALMFAMGLVFLIPIWMYLLSKMGIVTYRHFRIGRWFVPLFAAFLGIVLTPTADGINFLMVGMPVLLLYEIGLFVAWLHNPDEGNYLWFRTIARSVRKVWRGVVWVVRRPVVAWRRVERKLVEYGLGWWW